MKPLVTLVFAIFLVACTNSSRKAKLSLGFDLKSVKSEKLHVTSGEEPELESIEIIITNETKNVEIGRNIFSKNDLLSNGGENIAVNIEVDDGSNIFIAAMVTLGFTTTSEKVRLLAYNSEVKNVSGAQAAINLDKVSILYDSSDTSQEVVKIMGRYVPLSGEGPTGKMNLSLKPFPLLDGFKIHDVYMYGGVFELAAISGYNFELVDQDEVLLTSAEFSNMVAQNLERVLAVRIPAHYNHGSTTLEPGILLVSGFFGPGASNEKVRYMGTAVTANGDAEDQIYLDAGNTQAIGWQPDPIAVDATSNIHRVSGGSSDSFAQCFALGNPSMNLLEDTMCFNLGNMDSYISGVAGIRGPFKYVGGGIPAGGKMVQTFVTDADPPVVFWSYVTGSAPPQGIDGVELFVHFNFDETIYPQFVSGFEKHVDCKALTGLGYISQGVSSGTQMTVNTNQPAGDKISAVLCPYSDVTGSRAYAPHALVHQLSNDGDGGSSNYDGLIVGLPKKMFEDTCYNAVVVRQPGRAKAGFSIPNIGDTDFEYYLSKLACDASVSKKNGEHFSFDDTDVLNPETVKTFYVKPKSFGSKKIELVRGADLSAGEKVQLLDVEIKATNTLPAISQFVLQYEKDPVEEQCYPISIFAADSEGFAVPATDAVANIYALQGDPAEDAFVLRPPAPVTGKPCGVSGQTELNMPSTSGPNFFGFVKFSSGLTDLKLQADFTNDTSVSLNDAQGNSNPTYSDINLAKQPLMEINIQNASESSGIFSAAPGSCLPISVKLRGHSGAALPLDNRNDNFRVEIHDSSSSTPNFGVYASADCSGTNLATVENGRSTIEEFEIDAGQSESNVLYLKLPALTTPPLEIDIYSEFPFMESAQDPHIQAGGGQT